MMRLSLSVILLAVVFFSDSCASASKLVFQESIIIPSDYAGIVHAGGTKTKEEYAYLDYLGVNWILHTFNWSHIEPKQGEWDFSEYDSLVGEAVTAGIKVLGVLAYDNWWIHEDNNRHRYIPPERLPDFLQYVRKTVEHFRGKVDAWCIWNEPNYSYFWSGSDEEFIKLARLAADAVKETGGEAILLSGAFNRGVFGLPEKFIRKFFESGAMDKADAIAFHPYELNPARTALLYDRFRKIAEDYGFGDKIWITEAGYPTGGIYPTKIREKKLPEYLVKTYVLLAAAGSKKLLWYQMFDPVARSEKNSEHFFGLVRSSHDYTSKGAEAFRLCAKYLPGKSCYVQERGKDGIPRSLRLFWFKGTGSGTLVLWNEGPGSRQIRLRLPGTDHLKHDLVSGSSNQIQAETVIKAGRVPVFITWREAIMQDGENP